MTLSEKLCGILKMGIEKEQAAHDFYLRAADNTDNVLGKQMFERLAGEEANHETLLRDWSTEGECPVEATFEPPDKELLERGYTQVDKTVQPTSDDLEAIELGRKMERKAIDFYQAAAADADDEESKNLLMRLKAEEDRHLALLTDLYDYMKDPNLWSVRDEGAHFDS